MLVTFLSPRSASPNYLDTTLQTTPTCYVLRAKIPTLTKAHKINLTSSISPPKFDPKSKMSMKTPNEHLLYVHLGFKLYTDVEQKNPTEAEFEQIMTVFPTWYAATLIKPLLLLHYETLSPRPWLLTISGLPVYLTTELELFPLPLGLPAGGSPL